MTHLPLADLKELIAANLVRAGASQQVSESVARSIVSTEADDMTPIGLGYPPIYCSHLRVGKVNGAASPRFLPGKPGTPRVDAENGFANPAIEFGVPSLTKAAREGVFINPETLAWFKEP